MTTPNSEERRRFARERRYFIHRTLFGQALDMGAPTATLEWLRGTALEYYWQAYGHGPEPGHSLLMEISP